MNQHSSTPSTNSATFGGTALIREKSQLDFLLPLPSNDSTEDRQKLAGFSGEQLGGGLIFLVNGFGGKRGYKNNYKL